MMKPQMNTDKHRWIILGLIIVLFMTGSIEAPYSQDSILVIDLSKKLPSNPYQEEYERMLYPTVRIKAGNSTGSGVIFKHGDTETRRNSVYILSAAHVVADYSEVQIEIYGISTDTLCLSASVVITDTVKDLALLTTDLRHRLTQLYSARLAPADYRPYIFTPVYSVGCSLGLIPRPSQGIITVIDADHWEVSSPILPGNSGGPVFDARSYEVIGIAVWVHTHQGQLITTMAGIIPIQSIYEFLDKARAAGLYAQQTRPLEHSSEFIISRCGYAHRDLSRCNAIPPLAGRAD